MFVCVARDAFYYRAQLIRDSIQKKRPGDRIVLVDGHIWHSVTELSAAVRQGSVKNVLAVRGVPGTLEDLGLVSPTAENVIPEKEEDEEEANDDEDTENKEDEEAEEAEEAEEHDESDDSNQNQDKAKDANVHAQPNNSDASSSPSSKQEPTLEQHASEEVVPDKVDFTSNASTLNESDVKRLDDASNAPSSSRDDDATQANNTVHQVANGTKSGNDNTNNSTTEPEHGSPVVADEPVNKIEASTTEECVEAAQPEKSSSSQDRLERAHTLAEEALLKAKRAEQELVEARRVAEEAAQAEEQLRLLAQQEVFFSSFPSITTINGNKTKSKN